MKKVFGLLLLLILLAGVWASGPAYAQENGETVDVIILADGNTDGLVAHIQALGGTVKFQYKNVDAVAASIPADKLDDVRGFAG